MERIDKTVLVIFGVTGDLCRRKLLPALYRLEKSGLLPSGFMILGITRQGTTPEDIVALTRTSVGSGAEEEVLSRLRRAISVVSMRMDDPEGYGPLIDRLREIDMGAGEAVSRLFYLAIPATLFGTVTSRLGREDVNLSREGRRVSRFLIEKPFGYSLDSARALIRDLDERFEARQIFRIDHYLAKETAQNILAFRFENPLFCRAWNNRHVSHILVTAAESIGIEGRTAFYEGMGAMRDLVQSHLLQLLALVTMKKPKSMRDEDIHAEKEYLLSKILPPAPERMREFTVRGQYRGYRDETGISDSSTETYAACRLEIDTDEWRGVPVFIRTGKAMAEKVTEINVVFSGDDPGGRKNILTLRIQPNEGIVIDLAIKRPGFEYATEEVQLDFCYQDKLALSHPDAYERVLFDAIRGDRTLFASSEEVIQGWRITEPILKAWSEPDFPLEFYDRGSWGPEGADRLVGETGIAWLTDAHNVCTVPRRLEDRGQASGNPVKY